MNPIGDFILICMMVSGTGALGYVIGHQDGYNKAIKDMKKAPVKES